MAVAFDISEVVTVGSWLSDAANKVDANLADAFMGWADEVADVMRDEVPKDTMEMHDSITVERAADGFTVGPTNTDERGRPIGFFVNYGAGNRQPDDFIGRTAVRAREEAQFFDVSAVL